MNRITFNTRVCHPIIQLLRRDFHSQSSLKQLSELTTTREVSDAYKGHHLRNVTQLNHLNPVTHAENQFIAALKKNMNYNDDDCHHIYLVCANFIHAYENNTKFMDEMIEFISKHFKPTDVLKNAKVFNLHPITLKNRIRVLKEMGFDSLKVSQIIVSAKKTLNSTPIELKASNLYDKHRNVVSHFLSNINCPKIIRNEIESELNYLPVKDVDFVSFNTIRQIAITKYLSFKLNCTQEEALNIFESKKCRLYNSVIFADLDLVINSLLNDFNFSCDTIKKHPLLLTANYNNLQTILRNRHIIFGDRFTELYTDLPIILIVKYATLRNNVSILREYGFTDNQILNYTFILTRSTKSIKNNLDILNESENFQKFKSDDHVLQCVAYMKEAPLAFEQLISEGHDLSDITTRLVKNKICLRTRKPKTKNKVKIDDYLLNKFNVEFSSLAPIIGAHPHRGQLWLSVDNANKIVEFFVKQNLTDKQILNGIYVLLYEFNHVKYHYNKMRSLEELQPFDTQWKTNPLLLQLLLYNIEKNYSFLGIGIYNVRNKKVDESEK